MVKILEDNKSGLSLDEALRQFLETQEGSQEMTRSQCEIGCNDGEQPPRGMVYRPLDIRAYCESSCNSGLEGGGDDDD